MTSSFSPGDFYKVLSDCGIDFYTGVPDSLLKDFCFFINDNVGSESHLIAANEGGALALGIGYHLATSKIPLIYLQNSGIGNLVNPLLSLADTDVYSIPGILLIGWRGEPGVKDEPQHVKQGRVTLDLLEVMEIPYIILDKDKEYDESVHDIKKIVEFSQNLNSVHAIVVKKGFFSSYKPEHKKEAPVFNLTREQAIQLIVDQLDESDVVISTTGLASRELYEYRKESGSGHHRDFLTVGGMGHANQIGLGVALNKDDRRIVCLDGDGAALMHMGGMALIGTIKPGNFIHVVLNNGSHDSVGGQETVAYDIDLMEIARAMGYNHVFTVYSEDEIIDVIQDESLSGAIFMQIKLTRGWRSEIGRPEKTPIENKVDFMSTLSRSAD